MTILQKTVTGNVIYSHFRYLCPYHTWLLFNVALPEEVPATHNDAGSQIICEE